MEQITTLFISAAVQSVPQEINKKGKELAEEEDKEQIHGKYTPKWLCLFITIFDLIYKI